MHNKEKMKEIYKKVIEQASPLVETSLQEGKSFDKEKFFFLVEATKGLKEVCELEMLEEGRDALYDYFDYEGDEGFRSGKREYVRGYTRPDGERVRGYYRNARQRRDKMGRFIPERNGKIVIRDTYDLNEDGTYGLNGLDYGYETEYDYGRRDSDYRNGRMGVDGGYVLNDRTKKANLRNYRFKKKHSDEYDTEIEEEIYKVLERNEGKEGEVIEKIIGILAEPVQDMRVLYPKLYEKIINKIKVME